MQSEPALVIDDEPQIRRVVRNALQSEVGRVLEAATGSEGLDLAAAARPALVVLDLGLPDMAGVDVCRELRKWSAAPIIVLSARHSDQEKVALLDAGADDYLTKPFSTIELQARTRALLRRARMVPLHGAERPIEVGGVTIDLAKPGLTRDGRPVHLTRTESHRQLFTAVWGNSYGDAQQYLRVHVRSLRRKIEADPVRPALIVTEPGVGYRFDPAL
jgi:two-component system KDP operon response regulator KdpE